MLLIHSFIIIFIDYYKITIEYKGRRRFQVMMPLINQADLVERGF